MIKNTSLLSENCFFVLIFLCLFSTGIFAATAQTYSPRAIGGVIDLSSIDLKHRPVDLNGEWSFYFSEFVLSDEMRTREIAAHSIEVPKSWNLSRYNPGNNTSKGYGTYNLHVKLGDHPPAVALNIPTIGTAFRLYIDGELLASVGNAGISAQQTRGVFEHRVVLVPPGKNEFDLTLQVANYEYEWGGIWYAIRLGEVNSIYVEKQKDNLFSIFLASFFLAVALYNLVLYFLRPNDTAPMVFAFACIAIGVRELVVANIPILTYLPDISFSAIVKTDYLTLFLTLCLAIRFLAMYLRAFFPKKLSTLTNIVTFPCIIALLVPGLEYAQIALQVVQIYLLFIFSYILWLAIKYWQLKTEGARTLFFGCIAITLVGVNDILLARGLIQSIPLGSIGLLAIVIGQSYITGAQFSKVFTQNEKLNEVLKHKNDSLQDLAKNLESKVDERTRELENANTRLKEIAHTDALTGTLNRHAMEPIIAREDDRAQRSKKPYSLAVLDIDHFKLVNDQHGHSAGDTVLVEVAKAIKNAIRKQDILSRWGGEEFLILLPETTVDGARSVSEKVRSVIESTPFILSDKKSINITVTCGIAESQQLIQFSDIFKNADSALYRGKEQGRNRVVVYQNEGLSSV